MSPSLTILVPGTLQNSHVTVLSEHAPGLCHYPNALQRQQADYPISDAWDLVSLRLQFGNLLHLPTTPGYSQSP